MTWDGVARSIITRFRDPKSGEYIHPEQMRTISIREAARIQSFPDWFVFESGYSDQYDQVGNALFRRCWRKPWASRLDAYWTENANQTCP